ncbi:hypothetical protein J4Q44_G00037060, partial [Coregonus suidteri]
ISPPFKLLVKTNYTEHLTHTSLSLSLTHTHTPQYFTAIFIVLFTNEARLREDLVAVSPVLAHPPPNRTMEYDRQHMKRVHAHRVIIYLPIQQLVAAENI